ncbi:amino acid permease [Geobacillus sp. LEMMJ02]|uniref:amino acid permease n=1 Tax=unclassified Geobacillus TaxID=2642459 RepID=UPI0009AD31E9|nr:MULTISPECIES: amino acid permease [unclassified Geobacillus]OPX03260.1 GABA permease (4-amino butyrate transport carrier) [Geobacillus sp. LEMMY01]TRY39449.1 amino acid permease [Geobacillus sp. LEMMJ02]
MEHSRPSLQKGLLPRHVQLMALGGMIGTGIFKGSSDTIHMAGPSVILTYLLGGALLFLIMAALAEMAIAYPGENVQHLIRRAFGFRWSFLVGWLYWANWTLVTVVELLAAGSFLRYWMPAVPLWLLALSCALFIIVLNLFPVRYYGETEFWLAGLKVAALGLFILLGVGMWLGVIEGADGNPWSRYATYDAWFPHGIGGMISALLVVMFSYGGAELIGVAVTEMKDADRVLPRVIQTTIWRVVGFYVLPIAIICGIMPWSAVSAENSPFVQVLEATGIPGAAHVMNAVLLVAVLSAANTGVYATSRLLFSMAEQGEASRRLLRTTRHGVPLYGMGMVAVCIALGVVGAYLAPGRIIGELMTIPGFTVLIVWMMIGAAQLKLRPHYDTNPFFRVKGFPYTTLIAVVSLGAIWVSFLFQHDHRIGSVLCLVILAVLAMYGAVKEKQRRLPEQNIDEQSA